MTSDRIMWVFFPGIKDGIQVFECKCLVLFSCHRQGTEDLHLSGVAEGSQAGLTMTFKIARDICD